MSKSQPMTAFLEAAFGRTSHMEAGTCPVCKGEVGEFRDSLSRKEYNISGMCQACMDSVFGAPE